MIPIPINVPPGLIKYGFYTAIIVAVLGGLWWTYDAIYESGRKDERVKWESLADKREQAYQKAVANMHEEAEEKRIQHQHRLLQVLNDKQKRQQKLEHDIDRLSNQRMFVSAKNPTCNGEAGLPKGRNSSAPNSTGGRVELHESVREDILRLERDAQTVANQYNDLRDFVLKSECLEVIE